MMLPRAEFLASLSKKRMASGALIRDEHGQILIVKPTYRPDWLIPGGGVEADESPRTAAERETVEEIGLALTMSRLLLVAYQSPYGDTSESLQFMFEGGVLTQTQIDQITLPADELSAWRMVPLATAIQLLTPKLAAYIQIACDYPNQTTYLEDGTPLL